MIRLWVKDMYSGSVHEVGTNRHDSLVVWDGRLEYENLQNGDGTCGDGYRFCNAKGETELFPNGSIYAENIILIGNHAYTGMEVM